jgi:hypothetical protein
MFFLIFVNILSRDFITHRQKIIDIEVNIYTDSNPSQNTPSHSKDACFSVEIENECKKF